MWALISSLLFLAAWCIMTIQVLRRKSNPSDPFMSLFFTAGIAASAVAKYYEGDPLFMFFALATVLLAFIDFYYVPQVMGLERRFVDKEKAFISKEIRTITERGRKGFL